MSIAVLTDRLLPQRVDNTYRGYKLALWLFGTVVLMKLAMSLNSIFNGYVVASSADGIPLHTFPSAAAQTVVALFAIWGARQSHDVPAVHIGLGAISQRGSPHACAALAGTFEQKADSSVPSHGQDRNTTGILHKRHTSSFDDRWPGAIASEPKQSSRTGVVVMEPIMISPRTR